MTKRADVLDTADLFIIDGTTDNLWLTREVVKTVTRHDGVIEIHYRRNHHHQTNIMPAPSDTMFTVLSR